MDYQNTINEIISELLGIEKEKITPEADFFSDFNAGKLELADIIQKVGQTLKIEIPSEKYSQITTVADLYKIAEEEIDEI